MNKIMLVGRLTRDPETRYTDEQTAVTRLSLVVNRRFKTGEADFINCVAFGKTGEFIQKYFVKGMAIGISGRLQVRSYTDNEGNRRVSTNVITEEAEFVERKGSGGNKADEADEEPFQTLEEVDPDDLPF